MRNNIQWQCLIFDELSSKQVYAILAARSAVFVVEQNCPYQDMDKIDFNSHHLIAWTEEGEVAAYARIVPPKAIFPQASIGRVITTQLARGTGIGKELISKAISHTAAIYPNDGLQIAAQQYLEKFYQSFGFETVSDMYLEDDIPHVKMILNAASFK